MGNVVGEKFDDFVIDQINARQSLAGKGFGEATLSPSDLLLLNNRNAWLKLASSVSVVGDDTPSTLNTGSGEYEDSSISNGEQRLRDIGINNTAEFTGNQLSQKSVLFNTLSEFTPTTYKKNEAGELTDQIDTLSSYNFRSGVSRTGDLWNSSNSYGLGGTNFGLTPSPGLISAKINCLGRGSLRTAEVEIKAYNQFQFEILELVYLRLGFTMMLEWGWDKYIDNKSKTLTNMGNTIIEDHWFKDNSFSQLEMLEVIQENRAKYSGNYDGFFGRVVNFDWSFNKNGTYNIKLKLNTLGDVIESLKSSPYSSPPILNNSTSVIEAGTNPISQGLYEDKQKSELWNKDNGDYFSFNIPDTTDNTNKAPDKITYYMTFSVLLDRIQQFCIPNIGAGEEKSSKQLIIDNQIEGNLCSAYKNQIAFDPKICLIRPIITNDMIDGNSANINPKYNSWWGAIKQFGFQNEEKNVLYGKLMNIYINYSFIDECLLQNLDKKGSVSIYKFLTKICDGINSSLGNFQQIEVVIRDDIKITIQDQNPIPGLELLYPNTATTHITPFEVFGFNTVGSGSSNFVTDFNFNTKITPQLASMISIGTTAANISTKNYDGTAFSKWNDGLKDRFSSFYLDPSPSLITSSFAFTTQNEEDSWKEWIEGNPDEYTIWPFKREHIPVALLDYPSYATPSQLNDSIQYRDVNKSKITDKSYKAVTWKQYIKRVKDDYQTKLDRQLQDKNKKDLEELYQNNYGYYLTRAFGGEPIDLSIINPLDVFLPNTTQTPPPNITSNESQYLLMEPKFIKEGKSIFSNYNITNNLNLYYNETKTPGNSIGFIPVDLSLSFKGLSGIKLYQQLAIRQDFLPKQYPKALKFIITKTDHDISNNDWSTSLGTISIPNVKASLNINTPSTSIQSFNLIGVDVPNADRLRESIRSLGLLEKEKEISSNGDISEGMADLAIQVFTKLRNEAVPASNENQNLLVIEVTGGNDIFHQNLEGNSKHKFGNAIDFTISPSTRNNINKVESILKTFEQTTSLKYLNEYTEISKDGSGPHFHFSYNG